MRILVGATDASDGVIRVEIKGNVLEECSDYEIRGSSYLYLCDDGKKVGISRIVNKHASRSSRDMLCSD